MNPPSFILHFIERQEAPAAAQALSVAVINVAMRGEVALAAGLPGNVAGQYDAQKVADEAWRVLTLAVADLCDSYGVDADTKSVVLAAMAAAAPVIPVKKAEAV